MGRDRDNLGGGQQALDWFPVLNGCKMMSYYQILTERSLMFILHDTLPDRPFRDKHFHLTLLRWARWLLLSRLLRLRLPLRLSLLLRHPPGLEAAALLLPGALGTGD